MSQIVSSRLEQLQNSVASKRQSIGSPNQMFAAIYEEKIGSRDSSSLQGQLSAEALQQAWEQQQYHSNMVSETGNGAYYGKGTVTDYESFIQQACTQYGVSPALVKSVIECESGFDPNAVSSAGAIGLMQLMPATAKGLGVNDPYDPQQNIMGGVKYLADLIKNFDGDLRLALAGYNMGGNAVAKKGITHNSTNLADYNVLPSGVLKYANKVIDGMYKY